VKLVGDLLRDLTFNREDVADIAIVMLSPKVCVGVRVDQLH
jgi:hypothetical protein